MRQAILETVKKTRTPTRSRRNAEKAAVEAPRAEYGLCEILPVMSMAKSSYEYAGNA